MKHTFGQKLKEFSRGQALTQIDLAEILGISRWVIDAWEKDQHTPSPLAQKATWVILKRYAEKAKQ